MTSSNIIRKGKLDEIFNSAHQKLCLVSSALLLLSPPFLHFPACPNHTTFTQTANYLKPFLRRLCIAFTVSCFEGWIWQTFCTDAERKCVMLWTLFAVRTSTFLWSKLLKSCYLSAFLLVDVVFVGGVSPPYRVYISQKSCMKDANVKYYVEYGIGILKA